MTTFYLDLENGNDSNNGTNFANRWRTFTNGATAARIGPGDVIRVMASPDPTDMGQNATWVNKPIFSSTGSITSSTNTSPIQITYNNTNQGELQTGDYVFISGHTTNTNANGFWRVTRVSATQVTLDGSTGNGVGGSTGTIRDVSTSVVTLDSAVTQNIAVIGNNGQAGAANWSAATNVTCSLNTSSFRQCNVSQQIAIATAFTTGKAAWFSTGTLNLSGYQQISFNIQQTSGTLTDGTQASIRLCTDTSGDTSVHTFFIPRISTLNQWCTVTVDLGTNLNSSIQSVALYVESDVGAQTFLIDNIIAVKNKSAADSLSLRSLIAKSSTSENWYPISAINGTTIVIGFLPQGSTFLSTSINYSFVETSETTSIFKRECIIATSSFQNTLNDSGTFGNNIVFSGGWDRTNMSTQSGKTFIDAYGTSYANITNATSQNYKTLEKICIVRNNATGALFNSGNFINIKDCDFIACNTPLNSITAGNLIEDSSFICSNLQVQGVRTECKNCLFLSNNFSLAGEDMTLDSCEIRNTVGFLSTTSSKNIKILDCNFINNSQGMSISSSTDFLFKGCTFTDNGRSNSTSDRRIITSQGWGGEVNFINTTHDVANPSSNFAVFSTNNTVINSFNENGNGILIKRYPGYTIQTDSSVTQSGNGISWRFNITSITAFDQFAPARLNIAKVACRANKLVTFKAWVRRDNTNLSGRIIVPAKQLTGVSETSASITAAANTWQELTITFTPTEQGVLEVFADAWTTTTNTNFWVDNLTITQEA